MSPLINSYGSVTLLSSFATNSAAKAHSLLIFFSLDCSSKFILMRESQFSFKDLYLKHRDIKTPQA